MLKVNKINFQYPHSEFTLRDIGFELNNGEHLGIFSLNSSGKTTLLKILSGVIPEYEHGRLSGEITFNGLDLINTTLNHKAGIIGIIFQDPINQFFFSTLEDDIRFCLNNLEVSNDLISFRISTSLKKVGLDSYLNFNPNHLSYGQQKLALLGINLAINPDILLLDEIYSSLDSETASRINNILNEFTKQGGIIISTDRDIGNLNGTNKLLILEQGQEKFFGLTVDYFKHQTPEEQRLYSWNE